MPKRVAVNAGDLRKPCRILTRKDTTQVGGGAKPTYTDLFGDDVWAKDTHGRTRYYDTAAQKVIFQTYHTYTIRYNLDIKPGMYLQDPDFPTPMVIQGAIDPEEGLRRWMELSCTDTEG
jgi:head-tail adaptor